MRPVANSVSIFTVISPPVRRAMEDSNDSAAAYDFDSTVEKPQTPALASPPRSLTPPLQNAKSANTNHAPGQSTKLLDRTSESVDPDILSKALKEYKEAGKQRERTPGGSPSRKRQRVYGDRYVCFFL